MSMGWIRYRLSVPSRTSRAIPPASPGMLENIRLMCVSRRYAIISR